MEYEKKKCLMSKIAQSCEREYTKKAVKALFMIADNDVNSVCKAVWNYETELLLQFEEEYHDLCKMDFAFGYAPTVEYTGLNCGCGHLIKITSGMIIVNTEFGELKLGNGRDHIWQPFAAAKLIHELELDQYK